jgi:hypothetical protein
MLRFLTQLHIELFDHLSVSSGHLWTASITCMFYVSLHQVQVIFLCSLMTLVQKLIHHTIFFCCWMSFHVLIDHESAQIMIELLVDIILDHAKNIKTRENWLCEVDVVAEGYLWVISSVDRISCCDYRASGTESRYYTCFTD